MLITDARIDTRKQEFEEPAELEEERIEDVEKLRILPSRLRWEIQLIFS